MLFGGDELVTLDVLTKERGPRLMPPAVNDEPEVARASLARLETLQAELLLPGHGDPWTGSLADAVAAARAADSRR